MYSQYLEEKELYQYLKWEHEQLKVQYLQRQHDQFTNDLKIRKKFL